MAGSETVYTLGYVPLSAPLVLARGRDFVSSVAVMVDGALTAPSAGTYALYAPNGDLVDDPTVSVVSDVARATVNVPATFAYGEGYREEWTLTVGGVVRSFRRQATVARFELHPPVLESELVTQEYPDVVRQMGDFGTSLQGFLDGAWAYCLRYLWRQGTPADVLCEPSDLYDWYRHEGLGRVFKAFYGSQESQRWLELWRYHEAEALKARSALRVTVDRDRDGVADALGKEAVTLQVHTNSAPRVRLPSAHRW